MTRSDLWTYREDTQPGGIDVVGYAVEAMDGGIGKVDEATYGVGDSYVVVDTARWIFGRKVLLPAGVIEHVDRREETVYVGRSKEEIKGAPAFDEARYREEAYRTELGAYYGRARVRHVEDEIF